MCECLKAYKNEYFSLSKAVLVFAWDLSKESVWNKRGQIFVTHVNMRLGSKLYIFSNWSHKKNNRFRSFWSCLYFWTTTSLREQLRSCTLLLCWTFDSTALPLLPHDRSCCLQNYLHRYIKAKRRLDPNSYQSKLSEYARIRMNNPNSSNTMDARRLHTGVSRAYTRSRIQCALTLRLELGLFVRIRAYSDNLLSYEYRSNVRLA
jgi:hypothetical protein